MTAAVAFELQKHVSYIKSLDKKQDFDSIVLEHLRMSGAYWGLTALDLMSSLGDMDAEEIAAWIFKCQHDCGGFGGNLGHDPHILYTLNAVQILALFDKLHVLDVDKVVSCIHSISSNTENVYKFPFRRVTLKCTLYAPSDIAGLQREDGSFAGDEWGEIDTRFLYAAVNALSILSRLDAINVKKATDFVVRCKNFDGGFGCTPGGESHAGQIFCCVAALAIMGALHHVDKDLLGWWLCERQVKQGGLNGRPEKLPDVCYSWWVLSSLVIIDRVNWIDKAKLQGFILSCQDQERGGISDAPNDAVDVFHTFFGVAGLSLLEYSGLRPIDPAYALPVHVIDRVFYGRRLGA